ncbi:MAG: carboxypeptidase regulatory-like domain-containing protein [Gemmatimonadota bacterium]
MFDKRASISLMAVFFAAITACGGGGGEEAAPAEGGEQTAVEVANAGTINGTVDFSGTAPANAAIDMSEEPTCAEKHASGATAETVIANNGKLKNVFVYIKEGLTTKFPAASENVVIDQEGCIYKPHVTGVMVGQGLVFKNSDGLAHNIKTQPSANRSFNISQPTSISSSPQRFNAPEIMVPVQCDIHGWMQSYVGVVDHPYFAVSGDDGSFSITNVPPGTYTVEAWHEQYGVQTQQVTVAPDGTVTATFNYSASMAGAHVPLGKPLDPHNHPGS